MYKGDTIRQKGGLCTEQILFLLHVGVSQGAACCFVALNQIFQRLISRACDAGERKTGIERVRNLLGTGRDGPKCGKTPRTPFEYQHLSAPPVETTPPRICHSPFELFLHHFHTWHDESFKTLHWKGDRTGRRLDSPFVSAAAKSRVQFSVRQCNTLISLYG